MGLRDQIKQKLRSVLNRLSGEYSAGADAIQPAPAADSGSDPGPAPADTPEVKVTRARLRRPPGE